MPRLWDPPTTDASYTPSSFGLERPRRSDPSDEASLHAIKALHGDIKLSSIDIMIGKGSLRHLLDCVSGKQYSFEIGMQCFGKTLVFFRFEEQTQPRRNMFQANRERFFKDYTMHSIPVERNSAHYCIVKYNFAGLTFLVRSVADAFSKDLAPELGAEQYGSDNAYSSINDAMEDIHKIDEEPDQDSPKGTVTMRKAGCNIPLAALIEISTKAKHGKHQFDLQHKLPGLWISRVPNHILAQYENHGNNFGDLSRQIFSDINVASIEGQVDEWEEQHQRELNKLAMLLHRLLALGRQYDGPLILYRSGEELSVKAAPGNFGLELPDDLKGLFSE